MSNTREDLERDLDEVLAAKGNLSVVYQNSILNHLLPEAELNYEIFRNNFLNKWSDRVGNI